MARADSEPTVWMKARRWHTYLGRPVNEGDYYLAHNHMVETIEILGFAARDSAPPPVLRSGETAAEPITDPRPLVPITYDEPVPFEEEPSPGRPPEADDPDPSAPVDDEDDV